MRFRGLHGVRVNCGVDYHSAQACAAADGYDSIFEAVLRSEGAGPDDLVIFISGSGDSDNLLHAAAFCRERGIHTLSFAGFDGGKITRLEATDVPFVVHVPDQQIAEDIIQALLRVAVGLAYGRCIGEATRVRPEREPKEQQHHRCEGERRDRSLFAAHLGNRVLARDGPGNRRGPTQDGHVATSTMGAANRSRDGVSKVTPPPATLVTTADHDDRVVPSHSFKFTAAMQAAQGCARPVLIRVETQGSHGYRPTDRQIAELADEWAFAAQAMGIREK